MYIYEPKAEQTSADFSVELTVSMWSMQAFRTKLAEEILHLSLPSTYVQKVFYEVLNSSFIKPGWNFVKKTPAVL